MSKRLEILKKLKSKVKVLVKEMEEIMAIAQSDELQKMPAKDQYWIMKRLEKSMAKLQKIQTPNSNPLDDLQF
jgi:hypothetical protein